MKRILDAAFLLAGIAILLLFTLRYQMPFRLDDVLLMLWAKSHSLWDAFDPVKGQLVNSFRPMFAVTAYALTQLTDWDHPFLWHLTLDLSLLGAIAFIGLTARYLIGRWYALEISIALYWLIFLSILNVFFWYSDLTFGLELFFTSIAWYFALRGLYEARVGYWIAGVFAGCLAVLSKEPAFVLAHLVIVGSFLLERRTVMAKWRALPGSRVTAAVVAYALLASLTLWLALVTPTSGNRFFSLSTPDLGHFIRDRIDYYSAIYLSLQARLLLFMPIAYAGLHIFWRKREAGFGHYAFAFRTFIAALIGIIVFRSVIIAVPLTAFVFIAIAVLEGPEQARVRRLLPFLACLLIAMAALLFTIQLVKTQLTEPALLTALLASWAWAVWLEDGAKALAPYRDKAALKLIGAFVGIAAVMIIAVSLYPRVVREEKLLREVRDIRQNANDAVKWSAKNLPEGALLALMDYQVHGIDGPGALTSQSDDAKLQAQYTFDGGFFYDALAVFGRTDLRRTYLTDSIMLTRILASMRAEPRSYLFLQSQLDYTLFHGQLGKPSLQKANDTLVAAFTRGPYPSEIWWLRR